jgi:hypothetical protein
MKYKPKTKNVEKLKTYLGKGNEATNKPERRRTRTK